MKVLQLCFRPQIPTNDGGAIAMYNMSIGFQNNKDVQLSVFVLNTHKHHVEDQEIIKAIGNKSVSSSFVDTRVKITAAAMSLIKPTSYNIDRFDDEDTKEKLKAVLSSTEFDIVQFEGLYVSPLLHTVKKYAPKAKTVLRSHNIEHLIWQRRAEQSTGIKRWYLTNLANKLKRYEDRVSVEFDAIVPITEIDSPYYSKMGINNIFTSSTGVLIDHVKPFDYTKSNKIFHLGSLDWAPNTEAIEWFLSEAWPTLKKENPELTFYIAGKNMPDSFLENKGEGIEILGEIEDAQDFITSHGIMIVPLLSGSGMRIKIIEGMSLGAPIVSTSIGAEGIICKDNENIIIANTAQEFINELQSIVVDPQLREKIGLNAKQNIENHYSNQSLINQLVTYYQSLLN